MAESRAFALRALIEQHNIAHRSGWWPQQRSYRYLLADANHELLELGSAYGDEAGSKELADLQVMVYAIALRFGLSFADLDALAVQKLYLRFPGCADAEAATTR